MTRPTIGYTSHKDQFDILQYAIFFSIWISGGKPVKLSYDEQIIEKIDGLVIAGGSDLYPELYGAKPKPGYKYDRLRDELEMKWLRKADTDNIPVLAICRGAQFMNVARGGSLHMDIAKVYEAAKYPSHPVALLFFRKWIGIEPQSLLYDLLDGPHEKVNSLHEQAIDRVGEGLIISARESNGIVQAIEDPERTFFLGVQFHPELLIYRGKYRGLFKALIKAASAG